VSQSSCYHAFVFWGRAMRRRDFIKIVAGSAAAWPFTAGAERSKMAQVGALYIGTADSETFRNELREGLRDLGYVEGKNIAFEFRSAEGKLDRLPQLAADLVAIKVDVIVALYVPPSLAAKQATRDIPIVVIVGDPIENGVVTSLSHPGENITGVSQMASPSAGKCVELFHDMLPSIRRVGVLGHSTNPVFAKSMLDAVLIAAVPTAMEIKPVVMVGGADEAENAFGTMVSEKAEAVVVQGSLATKFVTEMAIKYRLPTASTSRAFVDAGGLMSFGADGPAAFRQGAKYVDRILRGKLPKDLPIEQPTKFELAVNLKTAKAIGLVIPEKFLVRADVVLE
jgi:putative tryptophan/tyrosine transport system substrate-binding protein